MKGRRCWHNAAVFASEESPLITASPFARSHPSRRISSRIAIHVALLLALLVGLPGTERMVGAAPSACPSFFMAAQAPDVLRMEQVPRTHVLCYRFYSVMASGITRTPLWSAEHLTVDSVAAARTVKRHDAFHAEMSLLADDRAELEDYRTSGFDRGHMSPSADMPDAVAQEQSFSLANMVPQVSDNNRHLWQGIEITTRAMTKNSGELYVVSGPAFIGPPTWLHSRVAVPDYLWKAIYDPKRGAAAYLTANREGNGYTVISIALLQRITGIDPFPGLSNAVKAQAIALPPPRPSGQRMKTGPVTLAALGLVFPSDGGPARTTMASPQPSSKAAQQDRHTAKRAGPVSSTASRASARTHHRSLNTKADRAKKKKARKAASKRPGFSQDVGVYGYGYTFGKTLKRLGHDLGDHGK
ncbi:DNA/RNA non-specific endonuclease [Robbsia andropogonis]|uniref:DNA/RNA non-specific endonuclease n=1 Tax=Robbsia andropogonis TaxID=28092 RepID=UPI00158D4E00|nr:DNA/RNA non-specific endonuclease [Robbsia andropogonis]